VAFSYVDARWMAGCLTSLCHVFKLIRADETLADLMCANDKLAIVMLSLDLPCKSSWCLGVTCGCRVLAKGGAYMVIFLLLALIFGFVVGALAPTAAFVASPLCELNTWGFYTLHFLCVLILWTCRQHLQGLFSNSSPEFGNYNYNFCFKPAIILYLSKSWYI